MAKVKKSVDKAQRATRIFIVLMLLVIAWFVAPLFAPVYRLLHVDFKKESIRSNIPEAELQKEYDMVLFYNPRGGNDSDPAGWCIMNTVPDWYESSTAAWKKADEYNVAVRCVLVSDRTGNPPNRMFIGGFDRDRYYKCKAWRFKPGALNKNSPRPVVLFKASTWQNMGRGETFSYTEGGRKFDDIDAITGEYDDNWIPPKVKKDIDPELQINTSGDLPVQPAPKKAPAADAQASPNSSPQSSQNSDQSTTDAAADSATPATPVNP